MNRSAARASLVAPSASVFAFVFAVPVGYFFVVSFWRVQGYAMSRAFTAENYGVVFEEYSGSLIFSFGIALIIAVMTTALAFIFAYGARFRAGRYGTLLLFVALITLFGGYLSKIYAWKTILGSNGILNTALILLGLTNKPITIFLYNPFAVVITLVHYMMPLAILPLYGSLREISDVPLRAARDLGARPSRVFRDIVLPQCSTGLVVAFALSFVFAIGDYATPRLVGGPYTAMIGTFIQFQFGLRFNAPLGSAMAFTVIAISVIVVGLAASAVGRALRVR